MKILMIDNYDSFTYNLVHLLETLGDVQVTVVRNDEIDLGQVDIFSKIILSPGPGLPSEAGLMPEVVRRFGSSKSILGVCLGHQCIGEIYGAKLHNLASPVHGKATLAKIVDREDKLFRGLPDTISVGRYHSWVVEAENLPDVLKATSLDTGGHIMSLRHREFNIFGVQFHPESILTPDGKAILTNWVHDESRS